MIERIRAALLAVEAEERKCPAQTEHLGSKPCPKCGARSSDGCYRITGAIHGVYETAQQIVDEDNKRIVAEIDKRHADAGCADFKCNLGLTEECPEVPF